MTLEEAIKHEEEVMVENLEKTKGRNASDPIAINCFERAEKHRQLAEWLKDYKRLLEQEPCENCSVIELNLKKWADAYKRGLKDGRKESVLDKARDEIERKANSGQQSELVICGMQESIAIKYLEYLDRHFDENEKWCILSLCPYYDHSGRYGGGCADHLAPKGFKCENPYS